MSKHTPGPWRVHPGVTSCGPYNKALMVGPAGRAVCHVIGAFEKVEVGPEGEANARLLATAPELLAAARLYLQGAEAAVAALNAAGIPCPSLIALAAERARAAIDKADAA